MTETTPTTSNPSEPQAQAQPSTSSTRQRRILLINGPNLNLLGLREPSLYGSTTLGSVTTHLGTVAQSHGISLQHFQSNSEGAIVDRIHAHLLSSDPDARLDAVVINPGAYTHTSVAIRDALLGVALPFVEVHITNVHAREEFRRHSYLSDKATAVICGLGVFGYVAAVEFWAWKWKGGLLEDAGVH